MILAKPVLIPLSMALLISFILFPITKKLEAWGLNRIIAAFLSILIILIIVGGGITLFSSQIIRLSNDLDDFSGTVMSTLSDVVVFVNNNIHFIDDLNRDDLNRDDLIAEGKDWLGESSGSLIKNTFSGTASVLAGLLTTIIFTFLFLIYREGLTKAFAAFGNEENRGRIIMMLKKIQRVGKQYLSGMFLLIIVLGCANSIGLLIIGIDSPFLFGFMVGLLAIIPYIGTPIGAIIPVLYGFMSSDSLWVPGAIILLFWGMQILETNFLNPKIVGSSLHVNPMVAILSLLIGSYVWGVAGMILFLPFAAMLKVICEEFEQLKPIAMLISDNINGDKKKISRSSIWLAKIKGWFKKN